MDFNNYCVFILCAGQSNRWIKDNPKQHALPKFKQLIKIDNETILHRTVRLLRFNGVQNITIVSHNDELRINNCKFLVPKQSNSTIATLKSTQPYWGDNDRIIILLGDVYFTHEAIQKIISFKGNYLTSKSHLAFFALPYANAKNGNYKGRPEIFGVSFLKSEYPKLEKSILKLIKINHAKLWTLYTNYANVKFQDIVKNLYHPKEYKYIEVINDLTFDFDVLSDYFSFLKYKEILEDNNNYD